MQDSTMVIFDLYSYYFICSSSGEISRCLMKKNTNSRALFHYIDDGFNEIKKMIVTGDNV